ncbi:MAG TPA: Do family serine endopeptidase [Candidatus Megaira endosymbiont of Nemacystus decipiens]|nr:Do family serine endopeptidase [Candidatus Megaera endosymbiont of Nemacystus decipiens]
MNFVFKNFIGRLLMVCLVLYCYLFQIALASGASTVRIESFADIIEPLMPTVVNIHTVRKEDNSDKSFFSSLFSTNKLKQFAENYNITYSKSGNLIKEHGSIGSGFIVAEDGFIITNYHVISDSEEINVKLMNNEEFPARVIGIDSKTDLALLKIETEKKLPYVKFSDSDKLRIGDQVIAVGNPFGFGGSVTTGIVSYKSRDLGTDHRELIDGFIQTDAAINIGNSGGPLFNLEGDVIGLNTSIPEISDGKNIGIGFAVPSNIVKPIMLELKKNGKIKRGKLGITVQKMTPELAEAFDLDQKEGLLIVNIAKKGPSAESGLLVGDLIISFNNKEVKTARKLELMVAESSLGEKISLSIIRKNKKMNVEIAIADPSDNPSNSVLEEKLELKKNGITFSNITLDNIRELNIKPQVKAIFVKAIKNDDETDLRVHDIILSVNQAPVESIEQFEQICSSLVQKGKKKLVLLVKRKNTNIFLPYLP